MLTRREFHKSVAGFAFAAVATGPLRATAANGDGIGDDVFLNRLTHGATPQSRASLATLGRRAWLDEELAKPATDAGLAKRLADVRLWIEYEAGEGEEGGKFDAVAEHRALDWLGKPPEDLVQMLDWERPLDFAERERPFHEVVAASMVRATHADAQLREVMTQFWHEHFSVNGMKHEITAALFPPYDQIMREHSIGNFRALLGDVAKSPAMLHYLNNDDSSASPANENYARELLELHTLGQESYFNDIYENWHDVPGAADGMASGYIDDDVYEVARAFTGWSIGDGREYEGESSTPFDGRLAYIEAWHDPYQKRVLGHELPAFSAPMADGETVLDLLAAHPGTARFVSKKMLRRLGIEDPSAAYLDAVAAVFHDQRDAPDQIAKVIRVIVTHTEFDATPAHKLRRPMEFLIALYRAMDAQVSPSGGEMQWVLENAGWQQHRVRPPTGHSDETIDWADTRTINGTVTLALEAHYEWVEMADRPLAKIPEGVGNMGELAAHWGARFGLPTGALDGAMAVLEAAPQDDIPLAVDDMEWINGILVASAALGPEFLFR